MNAYNKFLLVSISASLALFFAAPAKAEWYNSEAAKESGKACAYMGAVIGVGAAVIMEKHAVISGVGACALAGTAVGIKNYYTIPTDTPTDHEMRQIENSDSDAQPEITGQNLE